MKTPKPLFLTVLALMSAWSICQLQAITTPDQAREKVLTQRANRVTQAQRQAAAEARKTTAAGAPLELTAPTSAKAAATDLPAAPIAPKSMAMPSGTIPDYFGVANWAFSPPLRKFVDALPGLGAAKANSLGQYIPVGVADTSSFPGADYYVIAVVEYHERMHSDLPIPGTLLRGYVQLETTVNAAASRHHALTYPDGSPILDTAGNQVYALDKPHYLGPMIIAQKNTPVRIKFHNYLPTGAGGELFLPVDTTVMGAGMGPEPMLNPDGTPMLNPDGTTMMEMYTQNRATLHLHGGRTPWISDGTPHQWVTPAGEHTAYPKGVSVVNVPDMPDPGPGAMTFFYSNQQNARLMFYHDHAYGITRLNVYAGEAAGYLIQDQAEHELINAGVIPADQIPLIIQDKTFVDAANILDTDPLWQWGSMPGMPMSGDLWMAHVYVPAQNPGDLSGMNPYGRWHYGPWFWPPTTDIKYGPVPNPYYQPDPALPNYAPWQPPLMPGTPHPSMGMESFFDTPVVNGTAFPTLNVEPKAYRFRILNAANDRFWNLQLYVADSSVTATDGRSNTEVKMVPADLTAGFPADWPTDGRAGGVPDPATMGPGFIQIGTEGGFLPKLALVPNQPITWNMDPTTFNFGNVDLHALLLGPAERADVIIDFSAFAGKTLILYNDAPAAFPALDPRMDYYTGAPDLTDTGGHSGPKAGFGPNTRTIMQIQVAASAPATAYDLAALEAAFASTATQDGVFKRSQDEIIIPHAGYDSAYNQTFPADAFARIYATSMTFQTVAGSTVALPLEPKAIQDEMGEAFDQEYGRMSGMLGLELPRTNAGNQNFMLYPYNSPPVEVLDPQMPGAPIGTLGDGIQLWKITHNGVDTHPIHFHLYDVQLINRVGWDGAIRLPDDNELGWKDTVRVSPLEDTIVALRAVLPTLPFKLPNSVRLLDPTMPEGAILVNSTQADLDGKGRMAFAPNGEPIDIINHYVNFGWEYVWHCHILSHEEMDMMHAQVVVVAPDAPANLTAAISGGGANQQVNLSWTDNAVNESGFVIQRATDTGFTANLASFMVAADVTTYADVIGAATQTFYYRVDAVNTVGDTWDYSNPNLNEGASFPTKTEVSAYSNTAVVELAVVPVADPANLTATALAGPQALLAWTDNATNESGFVVERADNGGAFALLANVPALAGTGSVSFADTTVLPGAAYSYRVKAVNGGLESAYTNTAALTFPTAPAAPSNLSVTRIAPTQIRLT